MADIVIFIRGGVYQGAISDGPTNRIMVIDYDDEKDQGLSDRTFNSIPTDPELILDLINEATKPWDARCTP
jgi:hypothetical protein